MVDLAKTPTIPPSINIIATPGDVGKQLNDYIKRWDEIYRYLGADLANVFANFLRRDGTTTLTGNWAVGGFDITGIANLEAATAKFGTAVNYSEFEADGTYVAIGDARVWRDLQFSISGARVPAANAPTWEALTTNHFAYSFDVNDYKDQEENEVPHWWAEGTDGKVHIHTSTADANASGADRFAQFTVYIAYLNASNVWTEVSFTAELTIPNGTPDRKGFYLAIGTIDLSGLLIGTQAGCRVERIAATGGTEFAANMFITQVGIHLQQNTLGSRSEGTK